MQVDDLTDAQRAKYADIQTLLLSAGYFRVKDETLTPFNKVVGGLCWCIANAGGRVELETVTGDHALKQKISIAEAIVKSLTALKCPRILSVHQIQGDDMVAIFPVMQWLVKQVVAYRDGHQAATRALSKLQFAKDVQAELAATGDVRPESVSAVLDHYQRRRVFRRNASMLQANLTRDATVQSCLLEYGEKVTGQWSFVQELDGSAAGPGGSSSGGGSGGSIREARRGSTLGAGRAAALDEDEEISRQLEEMRKAAAAEEKQAMEQAMALQSQMLASGEAAADGSSGAVSDSQVGKMVGMQSDAIRSAAEAFSKQAEALQQAAESGDLMLGTKHGKTQAHKRQIAALQRKLVDAQAAYTMTEESLALVLGQLESLQAALTKTTNYNARVTSELEKLEAAAARSDRQPELEQLRHLVSVNESLKDQEQAFRQSCKAQLAKLEAQLEQLRGGGEAADEEARLREIETMYADISTKHAKIRRFLAQKNQDIARLSRTIDDIPTRSELVQYERRFFELYTQVAGKLDETRKYFSTCNMLEQTRKFYEREESIIQSIMDNFDKAMKSKAGRDALLQQCTNIIGGLQQTLDKQRGTLTSRQSQRDEKASAYQSLVEAQRSYVRMVREFQDACDLNEQLTERLSQLQAA